MRWPPLARVRHLQDVPLGVVADTPIGRTGDAESPLGNLWADALREMGHADVALNNNSLGGLRADLPRGQLTFGQFYDTFPFELTHGEIREARSALGRERLARRLGVALGLQPPDQLTSPPRD